MSSESETDSSDAQVSNSSYSGDVDNKVKEETMNMFRKHFSRELIRKAGRKIESLKCEIQEKGIRQVSSEKINTRIQRLQQKMQDVPFIKTKDKFSFLLGILLMLLTEFFVVAHPKHMGLFYTCLIIPLLAARFFQYHKSNYHYFMLDFCYYMQVWLILYLYVFHDWQFFKILFGLTNGPLLLAIVGWKNKMVFHDLDKTTSLFIHICPPLVTFCERWLNNDLDFPPNDHISMYHIFVMVVFYALWQILYFFKTDVVDRRKFRRDKTLMTSERWLTQINPHPVYRFLVSKGFRGRKTLLWTFQLLYTLLGFILTIPMYNNFWAHLGSIIFSLGYAAWYGSQYYFEVFAENYSARLMKKLNGDNEKEKEKDRNTKYTPSSSMSVVIFVAYFSIGLLAIIKLAEILIWVE